MAKGIFGHTAGESLAGAGIPDPHAQPAMTLSRSSIDRARRRPVISVRRTKAPDCSTGTRRLRDSRASKNYWVSTASASGRPHAMPVWGVWLGDRFAFSTSPDIAQGAQPARQPADRGTPRRRQCGDRARRPRHAKSATERNCWRSSTHTIRSTVELHVDQVSDGVFDVRPDAAFAWLGGEGEAFGGTATRWQFATRDNTNR